jgi:serine/threonine protein kinase
VYYFAPKVRKVNANFERPSNFGFDDANGRYRCMIHDHIQYRYEILGELGQGTFGDCVEAYDHKTRTNVAIKILKTAKDSLSQGQYEIKVLQFLTRHDKDDTFNVIHLLDSFVFRNHLCLVFELLEDGNLYTALKETGFKGFDLPRIREITHSIVVALRVLKERRIVHCDLKPENILLRSKHNNEIKIIDFGSSCFGSEFYYGEAQSRYYRAPEVLLNCGFNMPVDMFSLGCIVAEMVTGKPLFPGRTVPEQLMYQMEVLGFPSIEMIHKGQNSATFFTADLQPICTVDQKGGAHFPGTKTLRDLVGAAADPVLLDFVERCLQLDPTKRLTPSKALGHPFLCPVPKFAPGIDSSVSVVGSTSSTLSACPNGLRQPATDRPEVEIVTPSVFGVSSVEQHMPMTPTPSRDIHFKFAQQHEPQPATAPVQPPQPLADEPMAAQQANPDTSTIISSWI